MTKTILDLIPWLRDNGFSEGATDLEHMRDYSEYAAICNYPLSMKNEDTDLLTEVLRRSFHWKLSSLGFDYWYTVYERLCIIEENQ